MKSIHNITISEMINETEFNQGPIELVEADDTPHFTIEELWAMMPEDNKQYYRNSIEYYRHHMMAQTLKEGE